MEGKLREYSLIDVLLAANLTLERNHFNAYYLNRLLDIKLNVEPNQVVTLSFNTLDVSIHFKVGDKEIYKVKGDGIYTVVDRLISQSNVKYLLINNTAVPLNVEEV